jgi:hypothetical protein
MEAKIVHDVTFCEGGSESILPFQIRKLQRRQGGGRRRRSDRTMPSVSESERVFHGEHGNNLIYHLSLCVYCDVCIGGHRYGGPRASL